MSMPGHAPGRANANRLGTDKPLFIHVQEPLEAPDIDEAPNQYIVKGLIALRKEFQNLARQADNRSRPVDEYRVQTLVADSEMTVTIQPQYDLISERIESIVITGPTGAINVQLGDRDWTLTIPASGVLVIAPVSILLSRSDNRVLTASVAGDYSMELMGWADERY
jgi:hypothetical protein